MEVASINLGDGSRMYLVNRSRKWAKVICFNSGCIRAKRVSVSEVERYAKPSPIEASDFATYLLERARVLAIPVTVGAEDMLREAGGKRAA